MNKGTASVPFGFLLLAGLATGVQALVKGEPKTGDAAPAVTQTVARTADGPPTKRVYPTGTLLVEDFLRAGKAPAADSGGAPQGVLSAAAKTRPPGCFPTVGTLIATLPDPTDSHLDWAFDSDYESIVRAYERAGYVVDRYWLPWTDKLDTVVVSGDEDSGRRVRHVYPGVVLFRRDDAMAVRVGTRRDTATAPAPARRAGRPPVRGGPAGAPASLRQPAVHGAECSPADSAAGSPAYRPDLHLLYIVGETPTSGVHKDALDRALRDRDAVLSRAGADTAELRIVGPSFSGSARSIALVLNAWRTRDGEHRNHPRRAMVLTGSATDLKDAAVLRSAGGSAAADSSDVTDDGEADGETGEGKGETKPATSKSPAGAGTAAPRPTATVPPAPPPAAPSPAAPPDTATRDTGAATFQVTFGATVHSGMLLTRTLMFQVLCPLGLTDDQVAILRESGTTYGRDVSQSANSDCPGGQKLHPGSFIQIPFPMNIGSVRAEFDAAAARTPAERATGRQSRAQLTLRDPDRPGDRPPPSSQLTVPTLEVMLDEIERTVTGHRIRAVGIFASDVRDKLFLANELHRRVRDVQLFTFEGNALYLVPENNRALRGMLVVSSYPLNVQGQWWTRSHLGGSRLAFANEGAVGIHNAVLMQLGADSLVADYSVPFTDSPDSLHRVPPVWVSVVGRSEFVPVTIRAIHEARFTRVVAGRAPRPRWWPSIQFFTVVAIALLSAVLLYALRHLLPTRPAAEVQPVRAPAGNPRRRIVYGWARAALGRRRAATGPGRPLRRLAPPDAGPASLSAGPSAAVNAAGGAPAARGTTPRPARPGWKLRMAARVMRYLRRKRAARAGHAAEAGAGAVTLARAEPLPPRAGHELLLDEVRWASQNFHQYAYLWLRGLALLSVFVPVAAITTLSLLRVPPWRGPGGGGRVAVVLWLALVLGLAVWALLRYMAAALRRLREVRVPGVYFAFFGWSGRAGRLSWWLEIVLRALVFAGGVAFFGLSVWFTAQVVRMRGDRPVTFQLFLQRAADLGNGVSPILPLLLAAVGYAAWCTWHAWRIQALGETTPFETAYDQPPAALDAQADGMPTALPPDAARHVHEVRMRLFKVVPNDSGIFAMGGIAALAVALGFQIGHTLEGIIGLSAFDWILGLSVTGTLVGICWAVYRLLAVWAALGRVLREVGETPLLPAFRRLPESIGSLTRLTLWRTPSRKVVTAVAAAQWRHLKQLEKEASGELKKLDTDRWRLSAALRDYTEAPTPPAGRFARRLSNGAPDHGFAELNRILSAIWAEEPDSDVLKEVRDELRKSPNESTGAIFRRAFPTPVRLWLRAAEEFAAVQVVDYVEWVLQQMRNLTLFLFISLLLTTALLSAYPFQPQSIAKLAFFGVLLVAVGAVLYVMSALNRDPVLSLVAGTDPGRVNMDRSFVTNAVAIAVVPLLTLVGSEVPALNLFGWLPTLLKALGGG